MSKYRLSYLNYGGYDSIDLEKLECLKGKKVTDIQVIDELTTSFESLDKLLDFFKRNNLIDDDVYKLVITVDKKQDGEVINKKIYRGEKLLFKEDKKFLNISFIYKWIMANTNNLDVIIKICNNYIEKYKNAFNRITGSSYILSVYNSLRALAYSKKENKGYIRPSELREFDETIKDFINLEFYKVDKDVLFKEGRIDRKQENDGSYKKSYRNIHDFVVLLKSMNLILTSSLEKERDITFSKKNSTNNVKSLEYDEEEFLTEEDIVRANNQILKNIVDIDTSSDDYELCKDGNDFYYNMSKSELEEALYDSGMNLLKKLNTGDLN